MSEHTIQLKPIGEGETAIIFGRLQEPDETPIPGTLPGLTLEVTGTDEASGTVLNGRQDQNILGVNGGSVDALGNFVLELTPTDTARLSHTHRLERHVYAFTWTWPGPIGTRVGKKTFIFPITESPVVTP